MGRKYVIKDQQAIHFVTFTVVNWIDLFIRDDYKKILLDSLSYCIENKGLQVHAYCIMTSHVHLILSSENNLSDVIRDFKSHTSRKLKESIQTNMYESRREWLLWMFERAGKKNKRNGSFQLWQQHNHPIQLDTEEKLTQRIKYVHENPMVAGFVDDPNSWIWSSCASYEREEKSKVKMVYL